MSAAPFERGEELKVRGERGIFRFVGMNAGDGSATVYGGPPGYGMFRSFHLERLRPIPKKKSRARTPGE